MLSNDSRSSERTFVSIVNGKFTIRVREGSDGATERTTKSGKKVWERYYSRLEGSIEKIEKKTIEWEGKKIVSWDVHMVDESSDPVSNYVVSLNYSSREGKSLLAKLKNIDLELPVVLSVGTFKDKDNPLKEIPFLSIYQGGQKIQNFYTKENTPPMKKIKVKGQEVWDDSEQMEVFEKMVKEVFPPKTKDEPEEAQGEPTDDLPF